MSELGDRMAAIVAAFAAMFPARKFRRSFLDFGDLPDADLVAGVYTLWSAGEDDLVNVSGYIAKDGHQQVRLTGQLRLEGKPAGEEIEDAEFVMVEEVKAFLRALPPSLCAIEMTAWRQSEQIENPYGWIACQLEYVP